MWSRCNSGCCQAVRKLLITLLFALCGLLLSSCSLASLVMLAESVEETPNPSASGYAAADDPIAAAVATVADAMTAVPSPLPQSSPAPTSTSTPPAEPTPPPTASPTTIPSPTPIGPCDERLPAGDLLTVVTLSYGLSRDYEPDDLVALADYLPMHITMGYPSQLRQEAVEPLVELIAAMEKEELQPQILSAYRSHPAQAIAWAKWNRLYPEHARIISAPPGFSEHQLGTVVDFGSPELPGVVGQEDIEFHTLFYKTSEGAWLAENAHRFGYTLSFPADTLQLSGFYYEPWHFRYVGEEMAAQLYENETSLIAYQLDKHGEPCVP